MLRGPSTRSSHQQQQCTATVWNCRSEVTLCMTASVQAKTFSFRLHSLSCCAPGHPSRGQYGDPPLRRSTSVADACCAGPQVGAKKEYTPFPPAQLPSKIDLQLESGEYFLSKEFKDAKKAEEKQESQQAKVVQKKRQRESAFVAPEVRSSPLPFLGGVQS